MSRKLDSFGLCFWALLLAALVIAELRIHGYTNAEDTVPVGFLLYVPLAILALISLLPKRAQVYLGVSLSLLMVFVLTIDIAYLKFFHTLPSAISKVPLRQAWDVKSSLTALLEWRDLVSVFLILASGLVGRYWVSREQTPSTRIATPFLIVFALAAYYFGSNTLVVEKTHHVGRPDKVSPDEHWGAKFSNVSYANVRGIWAFHFRDLYSLQKNKIPFVVTEAVYSRIKNDRDLILEHNRKSSDLSGAAKGSHVVFLQLEAFQSFVLNLKIDGVEVTPFLNDLSRKGLSFEQIYDVTGMGRTSDAEFTVLTGMLPDPNKPAALYHVDKNLIGFPRELNRHGYSSFSFHGYRGDFWNRTNTHPFYGFQKSYFREQLVVDEILGLGIPDKSIFVQALDILEQSKQPFFGFVITLSNHHPFNYAPAQYDALFPSVDDEFLRGYLQLARYTDDAVRVFFEELSKRQLLSKTLLVMYGDHDLGQISPAAGSKQLLAHFAQLEKAVGANPYHFRNDKVPLIIYHDNLVTRFEDKLAIESKQRFGVLTDVFPTVLHLLDLPIPNGITGTNLIVDFPEKCLGLPPAYDFARRGYVLPVLSSQDVSYFLQGERGYQLMENISGNTNISEDKARELMTCAGQSIEISNLIVNGDLQQRLVSD